MKHGLASAVLSCVIALAALQAFVLVMGLAGARFNTSGSIPVGLYWTSGATAARGSYVMFCPPEREEFALALRRNYLRPGPCPGGYGYMMKQVAAASGDTVAIGAAGVRVNGIALPLSTPRDRDSAGEKLPRFGPSEVVLGADEVLLMTDVSATSFDARYFGPVPRAQIVTAVIPVLTW